MSEMPVREKEWWEHYPLHQVWCNNACPLVPRFEYREGDEYNANGYYLHWLLLHCWTMEHFTIGFDAEVNPNEVFVGLLLPYLRIIIGVRHTHYKWQWKLSELLRRKPAIKDEGIV